MADFPRTDDIPDPEPETTDILDAPGRSRFGVPRTSLQDQAIAKEWGFSNRPVAPRAQSDSAYDASGWDGSRLGMPGGGSLDLDRMLSAIEKPGPMDTGKTGGMMGTKPMPRAATPDELSAAGDRMLAQLRAQSQTPTQSPLAGAVQASRAPQSQLAGLDRQNVPQWLEGYMAEQKKKKRP